MRIRNQELKNVIPQAFHSNRNILESIEVAILGFAVGDALGVPVEFMSREQLRYDSVGICRRDA